MNGVILDIYAFRQTKEKQSCKRWCKKIVDFARNKCICTITMLSHEFSIK